MGLKSLKFITAEVEVADGETFTVRGVSLQDAAILVELYQEPIMKLVGKIQEQGDAVNLEELARSAILDAPALAASLIAMAADEMDEEGLAQAARLPIPVQLDAIFKIGELTFRTEGSLKKMVETVRASLVAATAAMGSLT